MKLLYIANARFPTEKAHGIQIAKMCEAFIKNGHEVELIVPRYENNIVEDPISFYHLAENVKKGLVISHVWTLNLSRSNRIGFLLSSLVFGITSAWYARRQEGMLYSIDLDYFSFFLIPFLKRPYFFEIHSAKNDTWFHRSLFRRITGVIAVNENVKDALLKNFSVLAGKVLVYPNGVDLEARRSFFAHESKISETRKKLSIREPAVVYTGSFQGWKGIDTIVETAKQLPAIHFYLVGGDAREFTFLKETLPANIRVFGIQRYVDMPAWQCAGNILLVTGTKKNTYSYNYTSPMKLFEYLGTGVPIIAADTKAIKSVVTNREVFFYKTDDPASLAEVVSYVLDSTHAQEVKQITDQALKKAELFSYRERTMHIIDFILSKT